MNKYQFSITSLLLAGFFATGCSQQQIQEQPEPMPEPPPVVVQPEPTPPPVVRPAPVRPAPVRPAPVVVKPAPRRHVNPDCHYHPANSRSKALKHCHKNPKGKHHYGNRVVRKAAPVRRVPAPIRRAPVAQKPRIDVRALQRKLKSKGYYKGPIDGVVGNGTRDALRRFQNR
jgi:hypothetical protein